MLPSPSSSPVASPRGQRETLHNQTNTYACTTPSTKRQNKVDFSLPTPPKFEDASKRVRSSDGPSSRKRIKLSLQADALPEESEDESEDGDLEMEGIEMLRFRARANVPYCRNWQARPSCHPFGKGFPQPNTRQILRSFVSSNKADLFKCEARETGYALTIPYGCAYSYSAKHGGEPLLAVSTEAGSIHILNTRYRSDWESESSRTTIHAHENGIFDVKWNKLDTLLATASGDQSTRILCPRTSSCLHTLRGHSSTAKCVAWDPNHQDLLSTGGRDGSICLWDLRVAESRNGDFLAPIFKIDNAQRDVNEKKPRGRKPKMQPTLPSITSILYPETEPYQLISSGSADGKLKSWDLRQCHASDSKHPPMRYLCSSPSDPTISHGSSRPRGVTSIVEGHGPSAGIIFAVGTDSRIHTYSLPSLTPQVTSYTKETMSTTSFYIRTAISPCGRWLACGGTGPKGKAFLYDVANAALPSLSQSVVEGVELTGQLGEVGAVDWAEDMLATCADDGTVRIWRANIEVERQCREQPEEKRWAWCWAE
ncbi:hypothetical protein EYR36_006082 [Pleurotus pulmonarius]|nr:hypothetical protein EYR36_006082 [Pleurotus pulmonarius]KAF4600789.1 hypothetical protein EYR38_005434 [Pleurotus pulmonarius]